MATGRVNVSGGGGLNIFTQNNEPAVKEGVWIKTTNKYRYLYFDSSIFLRDDWNDVNVLSYPDSPQTINKAASVYHDNKVYFIGGAATATGSSGINSLRVYDLQTNTWSFLANCPVGIIDARAVVYQNVIYVCLGTVASTISNVIYAYDIATNTWSNKVNSSSFANGSAVNLVEDKIYLIGGRNQAGVVVNQALIYDITNNSLSVMPSFNIPNIYCGSVYSNGYIYCVGGVGQNSNNAIPSLTRVDINTGFSTQLNPMPVALAGTVYSTFLFENKIYVLGGERVYNSTNINDFYNYVYVYDIANDSWDALDTPIPYNVSRGTSVYGNNGIYYFGGVNATNVILSTRKLNFSAKTFPNNSLVFLRGGIRTGSYYAAFSSVNVNILGDSNVSRLLSPFDDVYYYVNDNLVSYESYYGDGNQWIKFKEAN